MHYLTEKQLAVTLQVTRPFLIDCRAAGMPYLPIGVRNIRYDLAAVVAWLKENKEKGGMGNDIHE